MVFKRMRSDQVEPDLPITPMLDMSFQLLAFFIMTFKPTPAEAQIAIALPPATPGLDVPAPSPLNDLPTKYIVHVTASETGTIRSMTIREQGSALQAREIGSDIASYFKELQTRAAELKGKPARLILELDDKLIEEYVVKLLDHGARAGFTDIAPVPNSQKH